MGSRASHEGRLESELEDDKDLPRSPSSKTSFGFHNSKMSLSMHIESWPVTSSPEILLSQPLLDRNQFLVGIKYVGPQRFANI